MIDVSIIIINYNTRDLLCNCLKSVYQSSLQISFELIVVDNGSCDDSVKRVELEFPDVIIIANQENKGFAAANNQAFRIMRGRYALLLNSDTLITERAIPELFRFMELHRGAAMACGQLLNLDGSKQNSIANFPTVFSLLLNTSLLEYLFPAKYPSKRYHHENPIEIESGIGACLMVRREAIEKVGMLDERYFFFFEETDWARSMKGAGWKVYYIPSAHIYHIQGASIGDRFPSRVEFYKSRYQYLKKWNGKFCYSVYVVIILLRLHINWFLTAIANIISLGISENARKRLALYTRLICWHAKGRPRHRK